MQFSTKCWSEHILSAHKATKDLKLPSYMTFNYFRIWSSAKPRPMKNDISQSLGLDLDNINVYAEVYQNMHLSSKDKAIFTFSEFGARQSLDR